MRNHDSRERSMRGGKMPRKKRRASTHQLKRRKRDEGRQRGIQDSGKGAGNTLSHQPATMKGKEWDEELY